MKVKLKPAFDPVDCHDCQRHCCGDGRYKTHCPLECTSITFEANTAPFEIASAIHLAIFLQKATGIFREV